MTRLDRFLQFEILNIGEYKIRVFTLVVVVVVVAIGLVFDAVGIKLTVLLAGSAALLVGIGLGWQQTFNDIISGIILFSENVFRIEKMKSEIRKIINRKFLENNITIPFPQMDVYIKSNERKES